MPDSPGMVTLTASTPGAESVSAGVTVFDIASISEESGKIIPVYAGTTLTKEHFSLSTTTAPPEYASALSTSFTFNPSEAPTLFLVGMREQTITIKGKGCSGGKEVSTPANIMVIDKDWWSLETAHTVPLPLGIKNIVLFFEQALPNYEGGNSGLGSINGGIKQKYGKRIRDCRVVKLHKIKGSVDMEIAAFNTPSITLTGIPYVASIDAFFRASASASLSVDREYFQGESRGVDFDASVILSAGGQIEAQVLSSLIISANLRLEAITQVQAGYNYETKWNTQGTALKVQVVGTVMLFFRTRSIELRPWVLYDSSAN